MQLHRILTQYQLTAEMGPVPTWQPSSEDEAYIYRTGPASLAIEMVPFFVQVATEKLRVTVKMLELHTSLMVIQISVFVVSPLESHIILSS